ncbi:MAG: hypothetical protein H0X04_00225 [Chthoniobacterales bacterium]|nr:hypothetical protein [Chthoniobacterales bacterium]
MATLYGKLHSILLALHAVATDLDADMDFIVQGTESHHLGDQADLYQAMEWLADIAEGLKGKSNVAKAEIARRIKVKLDNQGLDEFTAEHDGRAYKYRPDLKPYVSVSKTNHAQALLALKAWDQTADLVHEDFSVKALEKVIIEKMIDLEATGQDPRTAEGLREILRLVEIFEKPTLSVRKMPVKSK